MDKLILSLLYHSNIYHVDKNDLYLQLLSHTAYPSIKAITDTLDYFGVENIAANVPKDALKQLPTAFLALARENEQNELVLVTLKKEYLFLKKQNGRNTKTPITTFLKQWTGTIIAIEKEDKKEMASITKKLRPDLILMAILAISAIAIQGILNTSYILMLNTILTLLGLSASYFIIKEELGIKDQLTARLCGNISNTKQGCGLVINSKEGIIFNLIPLKDAAMIYFSGTFIILTLTGLHISSLFFLSALSIPVVLFSVYQQAFILKKWCALCLIIALVLSLQFALILYAFSGWDFSLDHALYSGFIILATAFGWYHIKKLWKDRTQLKTIRKAYYTFKRNKDLFFYALYAGKKITTTTLKDSCKISFGKQNAQIRILAVTNPLCGYCSEPFKIYTQLLKQYPENIHVSIVFNVSASKENKANQIAAKVIDYYKEDKNMALSSLGDWFKEKDLNAWHKKYDKKAPRSAYSEQLIEAHLQWCKRTETHYTPETFINGYSFPKKQYNINDLQFFIEDLKSDSYRNKTITALKTG